MNERYLILNKKLGYFQGVDCDKNEPIFSFDVFIDDSAVLFRTEIDAHNRLSNMVSELKNTKGVYVVEKMIFVSML